MDLPWYRVDEEIKYGWKKLKLSQNDAKPCICWNGPLGESECRKKELAIRTDYFVQTKFSHCDKKIKIEFVSNGDSVRNIPQIYFLKFPKLHQYYVRETAKGYPKRVTEHCDGDNSRVSKDLEFKDEEYEKNLLTEIMEIVQPYDKKCGWCKDHANVLECWMQERLKEAGLTHHKRGTNTGLLHDAKCTKCDDFAEKYKIPWKS